MDGRLRGQRMLGLSELAPRMLQSEIRAMSVACDAVGGVNLAQGVCDTEVPEVVAEAAQGAIRDGHYIYTRLDGISRWRRAIADKVEASCLRAGDGSGVDPEGEVLVTSGVSGALHAAAMALFDPGDEVLLFEPFYGYHLNTLRSMRAVPVMVPMDGPRLGQTGWALDLERVRAAVTSRTKGMIVNTPSNPAGKVFPRAELEGLAAIAREHDLFVLTDEIYEHFVYGGAEHVSPFALPEMRERTILISGFSKTFSVTGWRVGYLVADRRWLGALGYFHDLTYVCAPAPFQHGCAAGLEQLGRPFYAKLALDHERKRSILVEALEAAGMRPNVPDGAYYILADASEVPGATGAEKARALLKQTGVAAVAGSAFFATRPGERNHGEDLLRFCFAKKDADLEEACRRLRMMA